LLGNFSPILFLNLLLSFLVLEYKQYVLFLKLFGGDDYIDWEKLLQDYSGDDLEAYLNAAGVGSTGDATDGSTDVGYDLGSDTGSDTGGTSGGLGSIAKLFTDFMGSSAGKGLVSGASLAAQMAALFGKQKSSAVDSKGNPISLYPYEKFIPPGTYAPTNLGYGTGNNTSTPPIRTLYGTMGANGVTTPATAPAVQAPVMRPVTPPTNTPVVQPVVPPIVPKTIAPAIGDLYKKYLGREGETAGLNYWADQFGGTVDANEVQQFKNAARPEQDSRVSSLADLYQNVLGRTGDTGGMDYWAKKFGDTIDANEIQQLRNAAQPELSKSGYATGGSIPASNELKGGLLPISAQMLEQMMSAGGQDDVVDIKAAPGEYIFDAEIVSALGDGNTAAGVRKLDQMRKNIREHKRGGALSQIAPKALPIDRYLENK